MKSGMKLLKKYLRTLRAYPGNIKSQMHVKYPETFGFETSKPMVQLYRNDSIFKTLVSFNHFVEVFTEYEKLTIEVTVQAYNRSGAKLKPEIFVISSGAKQFYLHDLVGGLDEYGIFSLSFKLKPNFVKELSFLQKVSCQFMTLYVPQDEISAPQMIHSHKEIQARIWLSRTLQRKSNSIEPMADLTALQFYFVNPSASMVETDLVGFRSDNNQIATQKHFRALPYSCIRVELAPKDFIGIDALGFTFKYNKNINHKKPIVFRKFRSRIWSCNHT